MTESSSFDLVSFIPLLRDRIYTVNPFAKQFLVSWVSMYLSTSGAITFQYILLFFESVTMYMKLHVAEGNF